MIGSKFKDFLDLFLFLVSFNDDEVVVNKVVNFEVGIIGLDKMVLINVIAASAFKSMARAGSIWKGDRKSNIVQYRSTNYL